MTACRTLVRRAEKGGGSGGGAGRPGAAAVFSPAQQQTRCDRRGDMREIQQQPRARRAEHARAHRVDDEGGAGVVAEGEQLSGLTGGDNAVAPVALCTPRSSDSRREPDEQGGDPRARDAEEPRRHRREERA